MTLLNKQLLLPLVNRASKHSLPVSKPRMHLSVSLHCRLGVWRSNATKAQVCLGGLVGWLVDWCWVHLRCHCRHNKIGPRIMPRGVSNEMSNETRSSFNWNVLLRATWMHKKSSTFICYHHHPTDLNRSSPQCPIIYLGFYLCSQTPVGVHLLQLLQVISGSRKNQCK